jgi:pescadillo protein
LALGATFQEDDESITHHVVDRPVANKTHINRVYVQPQWVFDCINENMLLPVDDYLPGAVLPPHLSPFVEVNENTGYVPPEKQKLIDLKSGKITVTEKKEDSHQEAQKKEENGQNGVNGKSKEVKKVEKVELKKKKEEKKVVKEEDSTEDSTDEMNDMKVDLESGEEEESDSEEEEELSEEELAKNAPKKVTRSTKVRIK